jgi:hypothetical protein
VGPANGRFVEAEDLTHLFHVELVLVIERENQSFAVRQQRNRLGQCAGDSALVKGRFLIIERLQRSLTVPIELVEVQQAYASHFYQNLVLLRERDSQLGRNLLVSCIQTCPPFYGAHRVPGGFSESYRSYRSPCVAPRLVDHCILDRQSERSIATLR